MLRFIRDRRRCCFAVAVFCAGSALLTLVVDHWISDASSANLYQSIDEIPYRRVALVLGCAEYLQNGRLNLYFLHRMNAAAELYHAGKCDYMIVSGDHGRVGYNEPGAMTRALVNRGVPEERIFPDFAGFRTLDSVVRAQQVFLQEEVTIVSQPFHNERAVFIARHRGLDAIGYNAGSVTLASHLRTGLREKLARVKTALDLFVTSREPRFLGAPIQLP